MIRSLIARAILALVGWKSGGWPPSDIPKYVAIGAPHTSNWDAPLLVLFAWYFRIDVRWMMKAEMFRGLLGPFFMRLGAFPIDRSQRKNTVQQCIEAFNANERMILLLSPEGTRSPTNTWKTGFYHIAQGAGVPIVCAFLDYRRKQAGFGLVVTPTGDISADVAKIAEFYQDKTAKYPEKFSAIRIVTNDEE